MARGPRNHWGELVHPKDLRNDMLEKRLVKKAARRIKELTGLKTGVRRVRPFYYVIVIHGEHVPQPDEQLFATIYKWWKIETLQKGK